MKEIIVISLKIIIAIYATVGIGFSFSYGYSTVSAIILGSHMIVLAILLIGEPRTSN